MMKVIEGLRPKRPAEAAKMGLSDSMWDIIEKAWIADPRQRPSLSQLASVFSGINSTFITWKDAATPGQSTPAIRYIVLMVRAASSRNGWENSSIASAIAPSGNRVVKAFPDASIGIMDVNVRGVLYRVTSNQRYAASTISFSADGRYILALARRPDKFYAHIWDLETSQSVGVPMRIGLTSVAKLVVSQPSGAVSLIVHDRTATLWTIYVLDSTTGSQVAISQHTTTSPNDARGKLLTSVDGKIAAIVTSDEILVYNISPLSVIRRFHCRDTFLYGVYSFDPKTVAVVGSCVHVMAIRVDPNSLQTQCFITWNWSLPGIAPRVVALGRRLPSLVYSAVYSSHASRVAIHTSTGVYVFDTESGSHLSPVLVEWSFADSMFRFADSSGHFLLGTRQDGGPYLWKVGTIDMVFKLDRHGGAFILEEKLVQECYGRNDTGHVAPI